MFCVIVLIVIFLLLRYCCRTNSISQRRLPITGYRLPITDYSLKIFTCVTSPLHTNTIKLTIQYLIVRGKITKNVKCFVLLLSNPQYLHQLRYPRDQHDCRSWRCSTRQNANLTYSVLWSC